MFTSPIPGRRSPRRHRGRGRLVAITALATAALTLPVAANATGAADSGTRESDAAASTARAAAGCPTTIDPAQIEDAAGMEAMMKTITDFGLRTTASPAHNRTINYLEDQISPIPGMEVRSDSYNILRWQATPENATGQWQDLARAGSLQVERTAGGTAASVPVAGAVPYSLPTSPAGSSGDLVYLAPGQAITPENAAGKVVVLDFPTSGIPFAQLAALSYYQTPDMAEFAGKNYDTAIFADGILDAAMTQAGTARAAGVIVAFDLPRDQVGGYFEPHKGTHYKVPAVYVGVDEREELKELAAQKATATVAVAAEVKTAPTRNLIGTLPGQSPERIIINANTDGNTWVQENGIVGMVALARYFASLPLECRPKTYEFVFATAHLHISKEGTSRYADQIDKDYDSGTVDFALAMEHLGTKEYVRVPRTNGAPGQQLQATGKSEPYTFFASIGTPLVQATIDQVQRHQLARSLVMRGLDAPNSNRVPPFCSYGGIGTEFNNRLIPTIAMISGPWSLWAPSFGAEAIDWDAAHNQMLTAGDTILSVQDLPRAQVAGPITQWRAQRAAGAPTCSTSLPPEVAPAPADPTDPTTPPPSVTPENTTRPTIKGKLRVGTKVSSTRGAWSFRPTSYTYRWLRNGAPIRAADHAKYRIRPADVNKRISVRVVAKGPDGSARATSVRKRVSR